MKLVLAEKPSVAQSIAKVLGAAKREDGYLEGNGYVVSWCVGHLVELAQPGAESRLSGFGFPRWKMWQSRRALKISGLELNVTLCMKQHCVESEPTGLLALTLLDFFRPFTGRP